MAVAEMDPVAGYEDNVEVDDLPIFEFDDGTRFIPGHREHPGGSPFEHDNGEAWDEQNLLGFTSTLWHECFESRRAELERLKLNSHYVDGFQYANAWQNRQNAITNRIYGFVEAQVSLAVMSVPRPEIVPRGWEDADKVERLQLAAEYIEDQADYDHAIYLGARDKFIYGYNVWLISFDPLTGMPFVKPVSVFDYYWDPSARNEDEAWYHVMGFCVNTHRLRATFPKVAADIVSDQIASPSYFVTEHVWQEYLENQSGYAGPMSPDSALAVHREGETPTQSVALTADTSATREYGHTTYILQFLIRDEDLVLVKYSGTWENSDGTRQVGEYQNPEPRCPSGWWVVSMTATNVRLHDPYQLDPCYLGIPLVIDRAQQRTDRYQSTCEVDQAIPIQRGMNRRKALLHRALELSANPPVIATSGHGMQADKGTVAGGEILTINRGSDVKLLEFRGPAANQFEMQSRDSEDMKNVVGVPDVQVGAQEGSTPAAAAIRRLDDNSVRRMNAKENPASRARALLLRKVMYCAGKKLIEPLTFKSSAGAYVSVAGEELCSNFHIRYARGQSTPEGKRDLQERGLMLYDKGVIDEEALLDVYEWPGRKQIAKRVREMKQLQMQAEIAKASAPAAIEARGA